MKTSMVMMAAVVGCIGMTSAVSATVLNNGSFETGDLTGWTSAGNIKVSAVAGSARPSDGLYGLYWNYGDLTPNGELSQPFAADIGTTYLLEFDFAKGGEFSGAAALDVKIEGLSTLLDEVVSDSTGGSPGAFSSYDFSFTADSTGLVLSFADSTSGAARGFDGALDNISITAIPEPSSIVMIGLAGGCTVFIRRRFTI